MYTCTDKYRTTKVTKIVRNCTGDGERKTKAKKYRHLQDEKESWVQTVVRYTQTYKHKQEGLIVTERAGGPQACHLGFLLADGGVLQG